MVATGPSPANHAPPAIVVAAPSSGSGKTTVTTGLLAALTAGGHDVAPFKVGPDYIDPGYHAVATGRPGRNLDPVLVGESRIRPLYAHGARGAEMAVVEGVMGLFDGRIFLDDPAPHTVPVASTAQVASLLGAPVLLVVDARGISQSLAALVRGFATHDPGTHIAGVVLNRVGSDRHAAIGSAACESVGVPVFGAVPRSDAMSVPSRHLGLVTAAEFTDEARAATEQMGRMIAQHVDLDRLLTVAATSVRTDEAWDPAAELAAARVTVAGASAADGTAADGTAQTDGHATQRVTVALAAGPAFSFAYTELAEMLEAAGVGVATFDPLRDRLPASAAAVVLPGGFPEEHAGGLAANTALLGDIAEASRRGMPIWAECAGLLYLCRELVDREGRNHRMTGVLPGRAEFAPRLTLGYRDAVALADSPVFAAGDRTGGHEFHRTTVDLTDDSPDSPAWGWRDGSGRSVTEGVMSGSLHGSYLHTHPAGNPGAVARFADAARNWARRSPSLGSHG